MKHVYEAINILATDLVNASAAGKPKVYQVLLDVYRKLCLAQIRAGVRDPFLLETIADFENDRHARIKYYRRAIALAKVTTYLTNQLPLAKILA